MSGVRKESLGELKARGHRQEDCKVICRDCRVCMVERSHESYPGGAATAARRGWTVFYCPKCSATVTLDEGFEKED